jgi:uncharacterized protein
MEARISLITLGVADLPRSLAFYQGGLGWKRSSASTAEIAFLPLGGIVLALYPRRLLVEDARVKDVPAPQRTFGGITIAHNVRTRDEVDRALADVVIAGGTLLRPAEDASWGGRSGYFADPDDHPWEVAWNPRLALGPDGTIQLP